MPDPPPKTRYTPLRPDTTPPGPGTPPRTRYTPRTRFTPRDQVHTPPDQVHPLGSGTPRGPGTPPWDQVHPPRPGIPPGPGTSPRPTACWEIRLTRGRYASYWNGILFSLTFGAYEWFLLTAIGRLKSR